METCLYFVLNYLSLKFKSYYVVWKLNIDTTIDVSFKRLNRTMQYGNMYMFQSQYTQVLKFKSYYVVWKQKIKNKK